MISGDQQPLQVSFRILDNELLDYKNTIKREGQDHPSFDFDFFQDFIRLKIHQL